MFKTRFSEYAIKEHILKKAIILIDTRENENKHITEYFAKKGITYQFEKLSYGDYGIIIPKNEEYGIYQELQLDYTIERKGSLEELSGNFTGDRDRIEDELKRGCRKMDFVIENGSLDKIIKKQYNTQYDKNSFLATLFTFGRRYGIGINFIDKENAGEAIYKMLYYALRRELKSE